MLATTLAERVAGPVFVPGADGYDGERTGFQRRTAHHPAITVGATSAEDVRAAVALAAEHGAPVAVQATGHGLASPLRSGLLLATHRMSDVEVDPATRTAWVAAGATWGQVIAAAAPYGLAPLSGSFPGVGAVSYTLGGGVGLLGRRYGFAADHVEACDLVTPDGTLRTVTADSEAELFWALRGGGGNFGVVTGMRIGLFPVPTIYGGALFFDVRAVPDVLDAWREWTLTVPDETTSAVSMLPFPDVPGVPEPLRGKHIAQLQIVHPGPVADAKRIVAPLRRIGQAVRDTLRELPYSESGSVFAEPDQPHAYLADNRLLSDLDSAALSDLPHTAGPTAATMCVVNLRHLGAGFAKPPEVPNSVGHRDARYSLSVLSPVEPGNEHTARTTHHAVLAPFAQHALGRSLNFSYGPFAPERVLAGFDPAGHTRLTTLKARYDPHHLLRANHAIRPVSTAGK